MLLINGDTIQLGEFLLVANEKKSDVLISFVKQLNDTEAFEEEKFWNGNINGIVPIEQLKLETEKRLIRIKTEQKLAEKYKIIKTFNYSDFILTLEKDNKRRLEAFKNKKPVYGKVQYPQEFYYRYLYNNMVIKLKDSLAKEVFILNELKYRDFYNTHKDALFRNSPENGSLFADIGMLPGYKSLDEVKGQIRQRLIEDEYEKLIDHYASATELKETGEIANMNINHYILSGIMHK
jgi:hypothetical protein